MAFAATMALATFNPASADENLRKQVIEPVVMIDNDCSAVNLDNKRLLTAAHCVFLKTSGKVIIQNFSDTNVSEEHSYWYDVKNVDKNKDVALLVLRSDYFKGATAKLATKLLAQEGDQVFTVGYPKMTGRVITEGLFNGISPILYPEQVNMKYRASPAIYGGNSGGGLFQSDGKGGYELIGITNASYRDTDHLAIYATLEDIKNILKVK